MKLFNQTQIKKNIYKIISPWYSIPLIDRWLLGQIMPPMIFAISAFTVISLSVGVMFDLIRKIVEFGLPLFLALKVLFFSLPSFLVLSFPMAVLLSTLLAYGKLSSNSELLALKSLGIKTSRIISPAIALSIFMTGLTFYFNDNLVPTSNKMAEQTLRAGIGSSFSGESGKDKTKKLGKLKNRTFKAKNKGKPYSTIFLIRSNITPTDNEMTVKAEIANIMGGIIWPNNHLSNKGIEYQGVIILLKHFLISD